MKTKGPLKLLRQLRKAAGLTQAGMAAFFGFKGTSGRNMVARWESGEGSDPAMKHRTTFMSYLGSKLGLRNDRQRFDEVWYTLQEQWGWPTVTSHEWEEYVVSANSQTVSTQVQTRANVRRSWDDQPVGESNVGHQSYSKSTFQDSEIHEWDAFVCYASEDKEPFVLQLVQALRARGFSIWFDEFELKAGDSLKEKIEHGLHKSRYAIVVLSPAFFGRKYPKWEYDVLVNRQAAEGRKVIIPIWHNVTKAQVKKYSPELANKKSILLSKDVDIVVGELNKAMEDVVIVDPPPYLSERLGLPTRLFDIDLRHPQDNGGWRYYSSGDSDIFCVEQPRIELSTEIAEFIDKVWARVIEKSPGAFYSTTLFKVRDFHLLRELEEQVGRTQIKIELSPTNYKEFKGLNDVWGFDEGSFAKEAYELGLLRAEQNDVDDLQGSLLSNPLSVGCTVIVKNSQNREFMGIGRRNVKQTATTFAGYRFYVTSGGFVGRTRKKFDAEDITLPPSPFHTAAREYGEEVGTLDKDGYAIRPEHVTFFAFGRDMAANFEMGLCGEINCPFPYEELKNIRLGTDYLFEQGGPIDWEVPVDPQALAHWMKKKNAKANSWMPFGWTEVVLTLVRRFGIDDVARELAPFITPEGRHRWMNQDENWTYKMPPRPDLLWRKNI